MVPIQSASMLLRWKNVRMQDRYVERVHRLYHSMEGNILTVDENPIAKIPLSVHGYDGGHLHVTPLAVDEDHDDENENENEDGAPLTEEQKILRQNRKCECDLSERKVRALRSDNQQIEALTAHIVESSLLLLLLLLFCVLLPKC